MLPDFLRAKSRKNTAQFSHLKKMVDGLCRGSRCRITVCREVGTTFLLIAARIEEWWGSSLGVGEVKKLINFINKEVNVDTTYLLWKIHDL